MTLVGRRGGLSLLMVLHNLFWTSYICTIKSNTNATYKLLALQPMYLSGFYSLPFQNVPSHKFSLLTVFPHLPVFSLDTHTHTMCVYIHFLSQYFLVIPGRILCFKICFPRSMILMYSGNSFKRQMP